MSAAEAATVNLFALLDQAAARFGDRGAVFCGERQLHTWAELRERALRMASTLGAPGTRIADCQREPPRDRRADVRDLGGRVRGRADQLQTASARDGADPRRRRRLTGLRVAQDRRGADVGHRRTRRNRCLGGVFGRGWRAPRRSAARHRSGDAGVAVLHQRHHRAVKGCDAHAPQSDGDDGVPPRRLRLARPELQPDPRRADVARLRPLHPAVRVARCAAGDSRVGRVRTGRVPRPLRAPSRLQRLSRAHDGAAARADRRVRARATCARSSTAAARCTSTA